VFVEVLGHDESIYKHPAMLAGMQADLFAVLDRREREALAYLVEENRVCDANWADDASS